MTDELKEWQCPRHKFLMHYCGACIDEILDRFVRDMKEIKERDSHN